MQRWGTARWPMQSPCVPVYPSLPPHALCPHVVNRHDPPRSDDLVWVESIWSPSFRTFVHYVAMETSPSTVQHGSHPCLSGGALGSTEEETQMMGQSVHLQKLKNPLRVPCSPIFHVSTPLDPSLVWERHSHEFRQQHQQSPSESNSQLIMEPAQNQCDLLVMMNVKLENTILLVVSV